MKALLMRSYNKAETVDILKLTAEELEKIKKAPRKKEYKNDTMEVKQTLLYDDDKFILREFSFNSSYF